MKNTKVFLISIFSILVFLLLILPSFTNSVLYAEIGISSKYIEVVMDNSSGRFYMRTLIGDPENPNDDKKILLFDKMPPTTYPTLFVDNEGFTVGTDDGYFENQPSISKNKLVWTWRPKKYNKIKLMQVIEIVTNIFTLRDDIARITFLVVNEDNKEHEVNVKLLLDTVLGEGDSAPFFVPPYNKVDKETVFYENNMPYLWYSFDNLDKPKVKTMGILSMIEDVSTPSMVVFAAWRKLDKAKWEYTPEVGASLSEGLFGTKDTAVAIYFKKAKIMPQEISVYSTMYGLYGDTIKKIENVFLSLSVPEIVKSFPVTISLSLENRSSVNLKDIKVTLSIDTNYFTSSNYTIVLSNLLNNDSTSFSWNIYPVVNQVPNGDYTVKVSLEALALSTNIHGDVSKKFTVKLINEESNSSLKDLKELGVKQSNISTNFQQFTTNTINITNAIIITNTINITNEYSTQYFKNDIERINSIIEQLNEELDRLISTYYLATSPEERRKVKDKIDLIKKQIEVEKAKLEALKSEK